MYSVRMKQTMQGSPDGIVVREYRKGEIVQLNDSLYKTFTELGACEDCKEEKKKPQHTAENKAISGAPENKQAKRK